MIAIESDVSALIAFAESLSHGPTSYEARLSDPEIVPGKNDKARLKAVLDAITIYLVNDAYQEVVAIALKLYVNASGAHQLELLVANHDVMRTDTINHLHHILRGSV